MVVIDFDDDGDGDRSWCKRTEIETKRERSIKITNAIRAKSEAQALYLHVASAQLSNQKQITTALNRRNVTTCTYLNSLKSAKRLSTFIAVDIKIGTANRTFPEALLTWSL